MKDKNEKQNMWVQNASAAWSAGFWTGTEPVSRPLGSLILIPCAVGDGRKALRGTLPERSLMVLCPGKNVSWRAE